MNSSLFILLIFAMIYVHSAKANEEKDITQRIEDVMKDVQTFINNPAIQQAAKAHAGTKRMLKETVELAKKTLTIVIKVSDKLFGATKCLRVLKTNSTEKLEGKITTYLNCELNLVKSIEDQTKKLAKDFSTLATSTITDIKTAANKFINCPANGTTLTCAEQTIKGLWAVLKSLRKSFPTLIVTPGWKITQTISKGIYACKKVKFDTLIAVKKEIFQGLSNCYTSHIKNILDIFKPGGNSTKPETNKPGK